MEKILIVSATEQGAERVAELIGSENYSEKDCTFSAAEARRLMTSKDYDIVFINAPLHDVPADELACETARNTGSGVIMFVKSELEAAVEEKVCSYGVFVIAKPVSRALFRKALRLMNAVTCRMRGIQVENTRLLRKIDDDRAISRAKAVLIKYLSMSESQAHKYLEKQAMDLRITKAEVAKRLLSTYEN